MKKKPLTVGEKIKAEGGMTISTSGRIPHPSEALYLTDITHLRVLEIRGRRQIHVEVLNGCEGFSDEGQMGWISTKQVTHRLVKKARA
jgi:hypothetical protein